MENKVHPAFCVQFHIDRFICGDWEGFYDRRCFNSKTRDKFSTIYCYGNVIQNRPLVRSQPLPMYM